MGKAQSKQPLSQGELYKIYRKYTVANKHQVAKSKRFLPLDLMNDESLSCFGCVPAKNRQKKWRKMFKKACFKLSERYEWAKILLQELKNFPSSTDKKYLIDLTWLKISLCDDENIYKSLRKVAPELERKTPRHKNSAKMTQSNPLGSQPSLSINRDPKKKNTTLGLEKQKSERLNFEISHERKEGSLEKSQKIEKLGLERMSTENPKLERQSGKEPPLENQKDSLLPDFLNPDKKNTIDRMDAQQENVVLPETQLKQSQTLFKSKSANTMGDYGCSKDEVEETMNEIEKKQNLLHEIVRESCVLEEEKVMNKQERDLVRMSFYLENKAEVINPEPQFLINNEEEAVGLNSYRHNTFINSIKMIENNKDSIVEEDEKKLNELLRAITHYKILTQEIEKHLKDPNMVLCNLKEKYVDYYVSKYDEIIKEKEQFVGRDDLYANVIDAAFEDLREFIEIFHQAIYHFYKIQYLDQRIQIEKSFFKPENIHNFLTSILMDRKIYSILYLSLIQSQEDKEDSLRMALQFCHNLEPKDFEVPEKYCLDQNTFACNSKIKLESTSSLQMKGLSSELDDRSPRNRHVPYDSAIKCLQEIEFVRSPLHKLKVLVKTGDEIIQCIEEFYKNNDLEYYRDSLSADDLLPVYTYVVAKSQVKCFYSQIKIIDELASRNLKNTLSGYYFVTLQIALNLIERCFQNEVKSIEENEGMNKFKEMSLRSSFTENMGAKLSEIKETNGPKKSIFKLIKDL